MCLEAFKKTTPVLFERDRSGRKARDHTPERADTLAGKKKESESQRAPVTALELDFRNEMIGKTDGHRFTGSRL